MEQKVSDKVKGNKPPSSPLLSDFDSDPLFFSSSFLDSSSGALSSPSSLSKTEFPKSTRKSSTSLRTSCLSSSRPKSVSNVYPPPLYRTPRFPKLYFQSNEFTIANSEYI
nr:protein BIG GRAIN 1-like A [Ipomoea trifida]